MLHAALVVNKNLAWFLINNLISNNAAVNLSNQINSLIKTISIYSLDLCEGFGIPKHLIQAPIYTGYEDYYKVDYTNGEHYNIELRPKF